MSVCAIGFVDTRAPRSPLDPGFQMEAATIVAPDEYSASGNIWRGRALQNRLRPLGDSSAETLNITSRCLAIDALTKIRRQLGQLRSSRAKCRCRHWAKTVISLLDLDLMSRSTIVASVEGGIGIAFRQGGRYADIESLNSGDILAITSNGAGGMAAWEVQRSTQAISQALKTISDYIKW